MSYEIDREEYEPETVYRCDECGEECTISPEEFSYAGTHCTNGIGGIHRTGHWSSDCCDADFEWVRDDNKI